MTLKDLSSAIIAKKYGNIPSHARPAVKYSDSSANELTKAILAYFDLKDIKAWRQASEGRYIKGKEYTDWAGRKKEEKGKYIPRSKAAVGIGDISSVINGLFVSWEVKVKKDFQKPDQKEFQSELEKSGGKYHIVRNWDDFYKKVAEYKNQKPLSI